MASKQSNIRKILVINPNSTTRMTEALKPIVDDLGLHDISIDYFTAPSPSPASIDDDETCALSAKITLPHIIPKIPDYDAFVVACYSEHPLVGQLRSAIHSSSSSSSSSSPAGKKFVTGIFEASILHALSLVDTVPPSNPNDPPNRWGIVTTGSIWESLLTKGAQRQLDVPGTKGRFKGVSTTGLSAVELHDVPKEEVVQRMKNATKRLLSREDGGGKVTVVCLGCAGMVGLEETVREAAGEIEGGGYGEGGRDLLVVDGVKAGILVSVGLLKGVY